MNFINIRAALPLLWAFSICGIGEQKLRGSPAVGESGVKNGSYLANSVMVCFRCHANLQADRLYLPVEAGSLGQGGQLMRVPGHVYARNITPYAIGNWSEKDILRAMTEGISRDGHLLFPVMPYEHFGDLDLKDLRDVVAYIQTLKPISKDVPPSEIPFFIKYLIKPNQPKFRLSRDGPDAESRGKYLVTAAACIECHTSRGTLGHLNYDHSFAGGVEFPLATGGKARSANITPDDETGIGTWSKDAFVAVFKIRGGLPASKVVEDTFNSPMPWRQFSGMTESDLGSIYKYLRSVPPIRNSVTHFSP